MCAGTEQQKLPEPSAPRTFQWGADAPAAAPAPPPTAAAPGAGVDKGTAAPQPRQQVAVGDFGERDSVRITAPVAAQHDVDAVARKLRSSGALNCVLCCAVLCLHTAAAILGPGA